MKRTNDFKTRPNMVIPERRQRPIEPIVQAVNEPSMARAALFAIGETISRKTYTVLGIFAGVVIGLAIGWGVWPVEYTGATYEHLSPTDKALIVEMASDLNAYDPTTPAVIDLRARWPELDGLACFMADTRATTEAERAQLKFMALRINQRGCE